MMDKLSKYYFKSHELLSMLDASSQKDEDSDLKNIDIIRIKGFTTSLISKIIEINNFVSGMNNKHKKLQKLRN